MMRRLYRSLYMALWLVVFVPAHLLMVPGLALMVAVSPLERWLGRRAWGVWAR